jgi:hypothetical protein
MLHVGAAGKKREGDWVDKKPKLKRMRVTSENFVVNDFDAVNFVTVTDVLFFLGCGYLKRYTRVRNRVWQFPRQKRALGVRVGCGVHQTERVQFRIYGRPEQSHNKPINIRG